MVIRVQIGDTGEIAEFPDGTSDDIITNVITQDLQSRQPQAPTQVERSQAEQEALASERFGMPPTFSADPRLREAQLQAVGPLAKQVGEAVIDTPADIPGGMAGAATGAKLGSTFGPIGTVIGGTLGGIAGATGCKQIDGARGLRPDESLLGSLGKSTLEEGVGVVGGAATAGVLRAGQAVARPVLEAAEPIIAPVRDRLSNFLLDMGVPVRKGSVKNGIVDSTARDPLDIVPRDIVDAQENLLGERLLTVFEETGGQFGAGDQKRLLETVAKMKGQGREISQTLKTRQAINQRLQRRLGDTQNLTVKQLNTENNELGSLIKNSFLGVRENFDKQSRQVAGQINRLAPKVQVDIANIKNTLPSIEQSLQNQGFASGDINAVMQVLNKWLPKDTVRTRTLPADGISPPRKIEEVVPASNSVSASRLKQLENEFTDVGVEGFQISKSVQQQLPAWYSKNVKPIIRGAITESANRTPVGSPARRLAELRTVQADLLNKRQKEVQNPRLFRQIGDQEFVQDFKQFPTDKVVDNVFKNPDNWNAFQTALQDVNPGLVELMRERFKADFLRSVKDPKTGEVPFNKLVQRADKFGDEQIRRIAGDDYLQAVKDSEQIALALDRSKKVLDIEPQLPTDAAQQLPRLLRPLGKPLAMFNLFTTGLGKSFNVDTVSDAALFKKMQGPQGARRMQALLETPLESPQAFLLYSNIMREIAKSEDILTKEQFARATQNAIDVVGQGLSLTQDEGN